MTQDQANNSIQQMSESKLLELLRGSDEASMQEAALEELLGRHYDWVLRMCLFELRDRELALDCAQTAMIEITKSLSRFDGRSQLRTWMFVIVKRCIGRERKKYAAKLKRQRPLEGAEHQTDNLQTPPRFSAEQQLISGERQRQLLDLIAELPERQRHAIMLHYFEDLSVEDAALQMGCSVATCKTHLHRGRNALEKRITHRAKELLVNE